MKQTIGLLLLKRNSIPPPLDGDPSIFIGFQRKNPHRPSSFNYSSTLSMISKVMKYEQWGGEEEEVEVGFNYPSNLKDLVGRIKLGLFFSLSRHFPLNV